MSLAILRCPLCKGELIFSESKAYCKTCKSTYPKSGRFWNFTKKVIELKIPNQTELFAQEERGMVLRLQNFYLPRIRKYFGEKPLKILDSGCGTGRVVKEFLKLGYDAFGIDIDHERASYFDDENRFFFADGCFLPFGDRTFDVIISFGVLEHIGENDKIDERKKIRKMYIEESLRVLKKGGIIYLSFPNGIFPIDFWHGDNIFWPRIKMRLHLPYYDWLPNFFEVKEYLRDFKVKVRSLSPLGHLQFMVAKGRYGNLAYYLGRLWALTLKIFFEDKTTIFFSPFLVLEIQKRY